MDRAEEGTARTDAAAALVSTFAVICRSRASGHSPPVISISASASDESFLFQLPNPRLQELPLWFLLGQGQRLLIRRPSLRCPAEPAVHICAGGMGQVIIGQFAIFQRRVDLRQTGLWTIAHGNGHGTIELYN